MSIKKIVVIGPESTGKSTLCKQLATHYNTLWVPEYARDYLHTNGAAYTYEDLSLIAEGQVNSEDRMASEITTQGSKGLGLKKHKDQLLFIDTDLYVMKVWSEFVFNKCTSRILTQIALRKYDLYLLCNTDLPWEKDALREYPDIQSREKLFHHYKEAMINQDTCWVEISGGYSERLSKAIASVDKLLG